MGVMTQAPMARRNGVAVAPTKWSEEELQAVIVGRWHSPSKTYCVSISEKTTLSFDVEVNDEELEENKTKMRFNIINIVVKLTGCEVHWGRGAKPSYILQMENLTTKSLTWVRPDGRSKFFWTKMEGITRDLRGPSHKAVPHACAAMAKALPAGKAIPQHRLRPAVGSALPMGPPPKAPPPQLAVAKEQRQRLVLAPAPTSAPPPPPPDEVEDWEERACFHMTMPPVPPPQLSPSEAEEHPLSDLAEDYQDAAEEYQDEMELGLEGVEFCPPPSFAPPAPPGYSPQPPLQDSFEAAEEDSDRCPPPFMAPPAPPGAYSQSSQMPGGAVLSSNLERDMMLQYGQDAAQDPGGPPGLELPREDEELPLDTNFLEDDEDDFLTEAMAVGMDSAEMGLRIDGVQDVSFPAHAASSSTSSKDAWTLGASSSGNGTISNPAGEEECGALSQWAPNLAEEAAHAEVNSNLPSESGAKDGTSDSQEDLSESNCAPAKDPFREQPEETQAPIPMQQQEKLNEWSADLRAALNLGFGDEEEEEEATPVTAGPSTSQPQFQAPANGQYFRKQPDHGGFSQSQQQNAEAAHMGQQMQDGSNNRYAMQYMMQAGNSSQMQFNEMMQWSPQEAHGMQMGMMLAVQYDGSYMQTPMQGGSYPMYYGMAHQQGSGQMHQNNRSNMMNSSDKGKSRSQRSEHQASSAETNGTHAKGSAHNPSGKLDPSFNNAALPKALRLARERDSDETASSTQEAWTDSSSYDSRSSAHLQYWNEGRKQQDYPPVRRTGRWVDRDYDRSHVPREITIGESDWRH